MTSIIVASIGNDFLSFGCHRSLFHNIFNHGPIDIDSDDDHDKDIDDDLDDDHNDLDDGDDDDHDNHRTSQRRVTPSGTTNWRQHLLQGPTVKTTALVLKII